MSKKIEWTVEMADKQIEKWKKIKGVIIRANQLSENDDCAVLIYKLYLQNTSVAKVAEILNEQGYRTPSATGTRKISSNDISEVIRSAEIDDKELQELVRSIHSNATNFINKICIKSYVLLEKKRN